MSDNTSITVRKADRRDATLILQFIKELADYEGLANSVVCDEETLLETMFAETPSAVDSYCL